MSRQMFGDTKQRVPCLEANISGSRSRSLGFLCVCPVLSWLFLRFIYYLSERQGDTEKGSSNTHTHTIWIHSLNALCTHNNQVWARLLPGTLNSIQVSHVGWHGLKHLVHLSLLSQVHWQGAGTEAEQLGLKPGPIWGILQCYRWQLNLLWHTASQSLLVDSEDSGNLYFLPKLLAVFKLQAFLLKKIIIISISETKN